MLQVQGSSQLTVPVQSDDAGHTFELLTSSVVYYVFANTEGAAWESAIRLALMPLQSIGLSEPGPEGYTHTHTQIIYSRTILLYVSIVEFSDLTVVLIIIQLTGLY